MKYTSTLQTLSHVVKTEGFTSLWKGFTPYFVRSGTHTVRFLGEGQGTRFFLGVWYFRVILPYGVMYLLELIVNGCSSLSLSGLSVLHLGECREARLDWVKDPSSSSFFCGLMISKDDETSVAWVEKTSVAFGGVVFVTAAVGQSSYKRALRETTLHLQPRSDVPI